MANIASATTTSFKSIRRKRAAELMSGIGALVLGIGLGVVLGERLAGLGVWALVVGAVVHAWGMYDKHRIEQSSQSADPCWSSLLYWGRWLVLAVGALVLSGRLLEVGLK